MRYLILVILCVLLAGAALAQQTNNTTYTVRPGDTLESVAQVLNVDPACIAAANIIGNPARLTPGQVLIIPLTCPPFSGDGQGGGALIATPTQESAGPGAPAVQTVTAQPVTVPGATVTPMPGMTATPASDVAEPANNQIYIVQRGDQLRRIAERYGVTWQCLARANNIADPNLIFVGQELLISSLCAGGGGGGGVIGDPAGRRACFGDRNAGRVISGGVYTIRAGDTLDFIACDLGIALSCLAAANPQLGNIGRIQPGETISVPGGCPPWDGPPGPGDLGG